MTVHRGLSGVPEALRGASVALGNFDGVHAGHRAVMDAAREAGGGAPLAVATFEPPPRAYFRPNDPPFRLMRGPRRNAKLEAAGAGIVFELPFDADMAAMDDEGFARDVLGGALGAAHVTVGEDFRFGRGRMGDANGLRRLGERLGFGVSVAPTVPLAGDAGQAKASSTAIRHALRAGEMRAAAGMLGHPWVADGTVERGEQQGRHLGFPTLNLQLGELIHPRHGVYAVEVRLNGAGAWQSGVANFGRTPTTGLRDPLLEAHVFDFDEDVYGAFAEVALVAWLRPELAFGSVDEMVRQMHRDAAHAKTELAAEAF